jgi:hypothetical protein
VAQVAQVAVVEPAPLAGASPLDAVYPEFEDDRYTILEVSIGKKSW